jgi:hypothetical protein
VFDQSLFLSLLVGRGLARARAAATWLRRTRARAHAPAGWCARIAKSFCMATSARSLAVCRILTAATLLYESTIGLDPHTARSFLSDAGLWSRIDQIETNTNNGRPSLLLASGDERWTSLLLLFLSICGVALAYGWRTRQTCAFAFIIWCSLLDRCWLIAHSFDDLTAVLLLWGALGLPWAETWAVDAHLRDKFSLQYDDASNPGAHSTQRLTRLGLWVSTSTVYFLAGFHKSDIAWADGKAVLLAMDTTHLQRPLGKALCESPSGAMLLALITPMVRPTELSAPLLLLTPTSSKWGWRLRVLSIVALLSMHLGIGLTLRLNAIGLINAAALAAFLPDQMWDALDRSSVSPSRAVAALGLKEAMDVLGPAAAATFLVHAGLNSAPASVSARGTDGGSTIPALASDAISVAVHTVRAALGACRAFVLLWILLFTVGGEVLPSTPLWGWGISTAAGLHLDTPDAAWYASWLHGARDRLRDGGRFLRLEQRYNVFSPRPPHETHWLLMPGELRGGLQVDLMPALRGIVQPPFEPVPHHLLNEHSAAFTGRPALRAPHASFDPRREPPPMYATETVHDDRWAKYFEAMVQVYSASTAARCGLVPAGPGARLLSVIPCQFDVCSPSV